MRYFVLFSIAFGQGASPDPWLSPDKARHFFMGVLVQGATFGVAQAAGADRKPAMMAASAVSLSAALAKELRDRNGHGSASVKDAIWTVAGAAAISPALTRTK